MDINAFFHHKHIFILFSRIVQKKYAFTNKRFNENKWFSSIVLSFSCHLMRAHTHMSVWINTIKLFMRQLLLFETEIENKQTFLMKMRRSWYKINKMVCVFFIFVNRNTSNNRFKWNRFRRFRIEKIQLDRMGAPHHDLMMRKMWTIIDLWFNVISFKDHFTS